MVYPNSAHFNWAEGCGCQADNLGIDDVGFVAEMINILKNKYPVDLNFLYAVGYSQGGFFLHRLVCDMPDTFKAVSFLSSSMSLQIYERCNTKQNLSAILFHGGSDPIFPLTGDLNDQFLYMSQRNVIDRYLEINECISEPTTTDIPDKLNDGRTVTKESYSSCTNSARIDSFLIKGGRP